MPMLVSKGTFDDMTAVASVCITGSDAMNGLIDGDDVERDTERIRAKWPGVTARDLRVAGIAMAFCLAALDGYMSGMVEGGKVAGTSTLLIRHGQTPSNVAGALDTGRPGPGLTALGRRTRWPPTP